MYNHNRAAQDFWEGRGTGNLVVENWSSMGTVYIFLHTTAAGIKAVPIIEV